MNKKDLDEKLLELAGNWADSTPGRQSWDNYYKLYDFVVELSENAERWKILMECSAADFRWAIECGESCPTILKDNVDVIRTRKEVSGF